MPTNQDNSSADIEDMIERLVPQPRGKGRLKAPPDRSALPKNSTVAFPSSGSNTGGGIDSPLTEDDTQRTYWPDVVVTSSDGLFTLTIQPYKRRVFTDAAGREVAFDYPQPA